MAADSVLPLQVVPASTAPVSRGSASAAPAAARSTFPAASSSAARGGGPAAPAPSARRAAQSSADGSPAAAASGPASSDSNSSNASRKTASSASDASDSDSRSGGRTARSAKQGSRASGAPSSSSTTATQPPAPGTGNFSAALAQSLAAAPAEQSALTGGTADKGAAKADTSEPTEAPAKHSAADPVASALALLEHALASALMGVPLAAPATTAAAAASAGTTSSPSTDATATGNGGAIALDTLLAQSLGADLKAGGSSTLTSGGASSSSAAATSSSAAATSSSAAASATAGPAVSTAGVASAGVASAALAAVQLQGTAHVATQQAKSDATMSLSSPVGSSGWADELGTKVTWMAHQGIESASLQLSPEHLGPLQVTISVHDGQASVWFGAAQSDTRTALQQSLPQLRQLFASQGLTLADAGVSREPPRGQGRQSPSRAPGAVSGVAAVNLDGATSRTSAAGGLGLVDTYV